MQLTRLRVLLMLVLAVTSSSLVVWHFTSAIPAPSRNSTCEPGGCTTVPCSYDNYQDSGKFLGKNCKTGVNDFSEASAYKLWVDENVSNVARFWEPGVWDFTAAAGAGATVNNLSGVTDWGIYDQTIFKCSVAACIALNIGNQNAVDSVYHAFNYTLHDLTMDGGGLSNSACLGVATALDVYVNHVILQNCFELGTGCLRVTNWNTQQLLSKGFYMENSQLLKCKITLSGLVNGYLRNSAFIGLANGASGTKALVDFSKGDIVPTAVNNLANFCFCGNTISGWTLQTFLGFQAISNDTIANNTVRDANTFMQTTDTAGGLYFEGLVVADNYYSSSTGNFASIGYGHSIIIRSNIISFDTNAAGSSNAIAVEKSIDPTVNQQPKNVAILNNEIYKWGGIGMDVGFTDGLVEGNQIYDVNQANGNQNSEAGISTGANLVGTLITGNSIISDIGAGAGASRPITYNGGVNVTITGNYFLYNACGLPVICGIFLGSTADKTLVIRNNVGYNPLGKITNPFRTVAPITMGVSGTVAGPVASTTYQIMGVDVIWSCSAGTGVSITINDAGGNTFASGLTCATLSQEEFTPIGWTVNFGGFSVAPTVTVYGN